MDSKHIDRDYSAHRKNVIRPYDEYVKLEVYSFDPRYTKTYLRNDGTLVGSSNCTETSWKSWSCFKATDEQNKMVFDIKYTTDLTGDYRIDLLYEQSNHIFKVVKGKQKTNTGRDLKGSLSLNGTEKEFLFDGENNVIKRKQLFRHFSEGTQKIQIKVPHNCYFMGVIIRKVVKFVGDNYYGSALGSEEGNMVLTDCTVTNSDMTKATELSATVLYDPIFECDESPSGLFMDYNDEVNFYVKTDDGSVKQIFGGYLSSILPDSDRTKLTLSCADRLKDGQNKYVLDQILMGGGTKASSEREYESHMTKDFDSYPKALKYLCNIHETTLKSNITKNFTVDGEKYSKGHIITFGKKKRVKKIKSSNGTATPYSNYIMLRNNASSKSQQTWTLFEAKKHSKKPLDITNHPYMHITYGLGKTKTSSETKVSETVDTSDTTAGSQKFTKCGVSQDKKYLMAIGLPSAGKDSVSGWTKTVFERKCPHCGSTNLIWDWNWGSGKACNGRYEGGSVEGHIFCISCDADYSVQGYEHISGSKYHMTKASKTVASSKSEARKLKNGEMEAVPTTAVTVTPSDLLKAITKEAFKYKYRLGAGSSSFSSMKKTGYGDCWAFSELIFTRLKEKNVSCKIKQYDSGYAGNHRSVIYKNEKGKWVDFPYREQGWGTKYNNMLNNYPIGRSFKGTTIQEHKGVNMGNVKASTSTSKSQTTTVTHTRGYDKDKPFQGYLKIVYSLEQSFKAKKYSVYIKFTQTPSTTHVTTSGINLYWINNSVKQTTLRIGDDSENYHDGLVYFLREAVHHDSTAKIYLQSIHMIAPKVKAKENNTDTNWYKSDKSTDDQSSCKINLYQISFNNNKGVEAEDIQSCGKSVLSVIQDLAKDSGYHVNMTYGQHRKDDIINFSVANSSTVKYTATEGDNNNILSWNSISYSPISSMFNMSMCVFKDSDSKYYYIDTRDAKSILEYGEQCTLQTVNDTISKQQAYFNCIESDKYNPSQVFNYSITVPNYPNLDLGDMVKVVANAKKLNNIKEVNSIKFTFDHDKIPRIHTELGLGELAPDIQLKRNIRNLRKNAKKEDTSFSSTAEPVSDEIYYTWDN